MKSFVWEKSLFRSSIKTMKLLTRIFYAANLLKKDNKYLSSMNVATKVKMRKNLYNPPENKLKMSTIIVTPALVWSISKLTRSLLLEVGS